MPDCEAMGLTICLQDRITQCEAELAQLDDHVASLKGEFEQKKGEEIELKTSLGKAEATLNAATSLLDKLSGEKERWQNQVGLHRQTCLMWQHACSMQFLLDKLSGEGGTLGPAGGSSVCTAGHPPYLPQACSHRPACSPTEQAVRGAGALTGAGAGLCPSTTRRAAGAGCGIAAVCLHDMSSGPAVMGKSGWHSV